jgi:hypothetical protein
MVKASTGASIGETLKLELPQQRDYTSTLLQRRLPLHFKRLKLDQFVAQDKDAHEKQHLQTAEFISKEIDALFTETNIRNKLEAAATGSKGSQRSIAWEQKQLRQNAQLAEWEQRLSAHQQRLRVLMKGGWPTASGNAEAADDRSEDKTKDAVLLADKAAQAREGGGGGGAGGGTGGTTGTASQALAVTRELAKELQRFEKAGNPDALTPAVADAVSQARVAGRVRGDAGVGAGGEGGEAARRGQRWRLGVEGHGEKHQSSTALQCSIDNILLLRGAKGTEADAVSAGADGATMFRKDVVKQMRHELGNLHQSIALKQVH